ncbi:hypothetical protein B296_00040291, partial [Ensete ventricosum]
GNGKGTFVPDLPLLSDRSLSLLSMATHSLPLLPLLLLLLLVSALSVPVPRAAAAAEAPFCPRSDLAIVSGLIAQCPRWIELSFPLEVRFMNSLLLAVERSVPFARLRLPLRYWSWGFDDSA